MSCTDRSAICPACVRAATWMGRHQTTAKLEPQAVTIFEEALREGGRLAESPENAALLAELSRVYMMTDATRRRSPRPIARSSLAGRTAWSARWSRRSSTRARR